MKSKIGLTLLLIAVIFASGCGGKKNKAAPGAIDVPVFAVNTILSVQGQIQDYISFSGDIVTGSTVDAYSDAAGKITEIYVSVGRRVNKGDRIAAVDPSRPGMTFRQSIVIAPISGTIVMVPAQVGMTINQAVPLARISGGGHEIKLSVAERFISRMAMNLPCEVTLDAWPGEIFRGSISEISPTVDIASRTMEVRVNVTDSNNRLKPGMFAKVRVITERKSNIVKIPASAVINRFGEQYVYVVEILEEETDESAKEVKEEKKSIFEKIKEKFSKKAEEEKTEGEEELKEIKENYVVRKRIVTPGILIDGVIEITGGLSPNEEVVVRGQTLLDDGSRVNIIDRVTPLKEQL